MDTCVFNYATMRNNVKREIINHMSEVDEKNDELFNSWFKTEDD